MARLRFVIFLVVVSLFTPLSLAQKQWIFSAMRDEMARTLTDLRIDTLPPPYYVSYTVTDVESYSFRASMGSLLSSTANPRSRSINVQMRVGSASFDNTNFLSFGGFGRRGVTHVTEDGSKSTTYEDDYNTLRRDLWLASDAVYKKVVDDLSKKKAALQQRVRSDTTADFSSAKPYTAIVAPAVMKFDRAAWEGMTKRLSAVLKKFPEIQYSEVNSGLIHEYFYFLDSDGSQHTRQMNRVWVEVKAKTQAPDGMPLSNFVAFYANIPTELPAEAEMVKQIETMARELIELRKASILDSYSGPILFERQAAAELVSQALGSNLSNMRKATADNPQLEQMMKSQLGDLPFQTKIGARILPGFISVTDNPRLRTYQGVPLIASFDVDSEGVPSQEVRLVEKGILKTLLTSRTPHRRIRESNGHARGLPPQAFFSNLLVSADGGKDDSELKKELIALCTERGLEFGIIIRKINNPYFKQMLRDEFDVFSFTPGAQRPLVLEPILVYKVYPDGREELVRGMEFSGLTVSSFKEILAASKSEYVYNHLTELRRPSLTGLFNPTHARVCVVTPSLLFESVDLKRVTATFQTPPIVKHPVFGK